MTTGYLPYTLELRAPLLVTAPTGDPNSARTLPYVPGSAIRGAVARAIGATKRGDPGWADLDELVLSGAVRYLNAYPLLGGRRCLPAPVSLRAEKRASEHGAVDAYDLLYYDGTPTDDHVVDGHWPAAQLGSSVRDAVTVGAADLIRAQVRISGRMHQQRDQRDRARGRAWTDRATGQAHGTVYGYESLDAGQRLGGVLAIDGDEAERLAERLKKLLDGTVLLGRSRRAGYGGDPVIDWDALRDREVEGPQVVPLDRDLQAGGTVRLLLTSPYLGRHADTGQPDPTSLTTEIERRLGAVTVVRRRWAFTEAGGYNRTWGLPLPQRAALAAGSVLLLRADDTVPAEQLQDVEHSGLGDRRVDGFGRCVFLGAPTRTVTLHATPKAPPAPPPNGQSPPTLVRTIERRIAEARVRDRIEDVAAAIARSATGIPTSSLIGRLRVPLRRDPAAGLAELAAWVGSNDTPARLRRPALDQLDRCRLKEPDEGPTTLLTWLRDLSHDGKERLNRLLKLDVVAHNAAIGAEATLRADVGKSATAHRALLVDAVLAALRLKTTSQEGVDG
ncbi:MAG: type III-B CRISPR module-associated Cmr3 family protein [Egibacteraceae bacterium]